MVYFEDTGAYFDAPIDFVWKYLVSPDHGPAHRGSARNFEIREQAGAAPLIAAERKLDGRWSPFVSTSADYPPLCVCNREVEGDFAGSQFVIVYKPEGERTRVDVYGDVQSKRFPPAEAKRKFLALLAGAYEDDLAAIRRLRPPR